MPTDSIVIIGKVPPENNWTNTTWLAPAKIIDDIRKVWTEVNPASSPKIPKINPNGTTPINIGETDFIPA